MAKITWIKLSSRRYGGTIYGEMAREALASQFIVEVKNVNAEKIGWRYLKPFFWFLNLLRQRGGSDLRVRDDLFSIAVLPFNRNKGKELAVVYHIDASVFSPILRLFSFFLEKIAYFGLKKTNAILTVSDYWKNYFLERGYKNVYKIYPAFNLSDFNISEQEISDFKKKFQLGAKPIVYLGNCQKAKGVEESYNVLKDLDADFLTSGEPMVKIPARNLNLSYKDYLCLLRAATLVITMSKFKEGWNITAHEAMLLKTPVIGSGLGGMGELLEGGKQIICPNFRSLREKVEYLLNNSGARKEMGEAGYQFAKNFTQDKFREDWLKLAKNVIELKKEL